MGATLCGNRFGAFQQEDWRRRGREDIVKSSRFPWFHMNVAINISGTIKLLVDSITNIYAHQLKHRKRPVGKPVPIKNRVSIDQRPECINNKERFGDWEVDTIIGRQQKGAILTIVERTTGMLIIKKLPKGKQAKGLSKELINRMMPYKKDILSITSDNGTEFADHQNIAKILDTKFYFAHPYCSWQRGLNEYTNKLIRQYIPKKTAFDTLNDEQITQIQHKINRRPREKLNFKTPKEIFYLNTA